jgi:ATP phosphoribosyltransferase
VLQLKELGFIDLMNAISKDEKMTLALPKGRILEEVLPLLEKAGIKPEDSFVDSNSRKLKYSTNEKYLDLISVRSFDVATFVAFGAADMGVVGSDVLMEFDYPSVYTPIDLKIGLCRLVVAQLKDTENPGKQASSGHVRVATKYPASTKKFFASKGIQAECIKLNGSLELAPSLGLCEHIVDLVSTGKTLKENNLIEVEEIAKISTRLVINRNAMKTRPKEINNWVERFGGIVNAG